MSDTDSQGGRARGDGAYDSESDADSQLTFRLNHADNLHHKHQHHPRSMVEHCVTLLVKSSDRVATYAMLRVHVASERSDPSDHLLDQYSRSRLPTQNAWNHDAGRLHVREALVDRIGRIEGRDRQVVGREVLHAQSIDRTNQSINHPINRSITSRINSI